MSPVTVQPSAAAKRFACMSGPFANVRQPDCVSFTMDVGPYCSTSSLNFELISSTACSQLMRSYCPEPRSLPSTRFMGYMTRSLLYVRYRFDWPRRQMPV